MGKGQFRAEGMWLNNVIKDTACFHLSVIVQSWFHAQASSKSVSITCKHPKEEEGKKSTFLFKSETAFPRITPSPPAPFPLAFLARIAPHAHS